MIKKCFTIISVEILHFRLELEMRKRISFFTILWLYLGLPWILRSTTVNQLNFALLENIVELLIRCLGMGCNRIFRPRLVNSLLLGVAITAFHIMWRLYSLGTTVKPICGEIIIRDFQKQWCRMHRWRVDWEAMAKPCEGQVAWNQRQVNSDKGTDARKSFITEWKILPAGKWWKLNIFHLLCSSVN